MSKLKILRSFLISKNLIRHANLIRKIAIDIKEEDILESIRDATEERNDLELFNYSSLFEDGKNYVILPKDEEDNSDKIDVFQLYEKAKAIHLNLGMNVEFKDYIEDPSIIKIFGETFSLNDNLNNIATKIYTSLVLPEIRKSLKDKFPLFENFLKINPISYLQNQNISTAFELERDIIDSSIFLNMPSEAIEKIKSDQRMSGINFDEKDFLTKQIISKNNVLAICKEIEELINLSNLVFSTNYNLSSNIGSNRGMLEKYKVVISYDPNDIATASYSGACGTNWWSCKDIKDSKDILQDIVEGGLVAYLVNHENPYPVQNPLARVRIRHYGTGSRSSYDNEDFVLIAEKRVYGRGISQYEEAFFLKIVESWVSKANDVIENSSSEYYLRGDQYTDTLASIAGPTSSKMYNLDIQGRVFRSSDAKRMIQRGDLHRDETEPSLTIQLAVGLTGLNFEESAIDELTKNLTKREIEDIFSISRENINSEYVSSGLLSKLLKTSGGRNLQYKSTNRKEKLTKEDLARFIKSFSNFFKIMFSRNISSAIDDEGIEKIFEIISSVFLKFDEVTTGDKIGSLFVDWKDKHSFLDDEIRKIISPIISNISSQDVDLIEERMVTASSLTAHLSEPMIESDRKKFLKVVSEIGEKGFSKIGITALEYLSKIFEEIFKKKEIKDIFKKEIDEYVEKKGNSYFLESYLSEDFESIFESISKILSSRTDAVDKDEMKIILNIAKMGLNDHGFIDVKTLDEAKEYLSSLTNIPKENIYDYYNLINVDEYRYNLKRWLYLHEKKYGFRFKKKVNKGGIISKYSIKRTPDLYKHEDAILMAKHYGLEESSIKETIFGAKRYYLEVPV